jgi:peptidylprolyl isomerase domain and WD repeat-containing protein 1
MKKCVAVAIFRLPFLLNSTVFFQSFMHKDVVTHVIATRTDFIISASRDGQIKFWKKMPELVEFVKKYKAHSGLSRFV